MCPTSHVVKGSLPFGDRDPLPKGGRPMPKTSSLLVWEPSRLRTLALRLRNRMNELRLTERELAERCQAMA
ncbi:MAG: hypothetical protein QXS54_07105, partial [Candidatus Methanomethylicaceae archaeon]